MAGGGSIITKDVPAYVIVNGNPAQTHGLNLVGLKRRGFERDALRALGDAYRIVYRQGLTMEQAIERLENDFAVHEGETFLASLKTSQRGITR